MAGWLVLAAGLILGMAAVRWWVPRVVARELAQRENPASEQEALLAVLDEYTALWTEDNQKLLRAWRDERRALEEAVQTLQRRVAELEGRLEALVAIVREGAVHQAIRGGSHLASPSEAAGERQPAAWERDAEALDAAAIGERYRAVLDLARDGLAAEEIARRLDIGTGEVQLVLTLANEARRWHAHAPHSSRRSE